MAVMPQILFGKVMHKRLLPKVNGFSYGIYYLHSPLDKLATLADGRRFGFNRWGLLGFAARDHGARDTDSPQDLEDWLRGHLKEWQVTGADGDITLVCMPRVLGYVFNPVSFWLCNDKAGNLRAVLCEVNNTFGETHSYICAPAGGGIIGPDDWLEGKKVFHVSPFLQREGGYRFRFSRAGDSLGIWIDYYNGAGDKQLLTALTGKLVPATRANWRRAFWRYPLVTLKAICLIHWQACKLMLKGIHYVPKPLQKKERITATDNLTKS